jgi:hypothetical protein|tara:strand:+ start:10494 stop:10859 length:366 start_codon:yes stop_codon:yes gene_type:complete
VLKGISSISYEHKVLIERYCSTVTETIKIITGTNASKYNDFIDVANIIIEHHNTYKHGMSAGNFYDFMSIIPTNLSIAVQGFLAGYETKRNRAKVRAYRLVLNNLAYDLILDMEEIKLYND